MKQKILMKEHLKPYGLTALLTLFSLGLMIYILKIYPFGDKTLMWTDSDQYFSIGHYLGSITGKNDMFYSWSNALGGNALSMLAYYSFSPFNVLYIVFIDHMIFAAHVITYSKIIAASLTFCYCLDYMHKDKVYLMKSTLSVCYAFMGYMMFYAWNASWMDGIILLPVMYVGILKIAEGKKAYQYMTSLTLAIISNFYIGFMLCIGSFILYIAVLLLQKEQFWKGVKDTFIEYAFFSVIGVALSAFVLLPAYLGVPKTRQLKIQDIFRDMYVNVKPMEILSGVFTGQVNSMDSNAPLIYVGIVPLMFVVLFFVCNKISTKKKMVFAALIITFVISFENSFFNKIWHGMSDNSWFNYRYSFFMSFILLLVAYEAYILVRTGQVSKNEYIKMGVVLFLIASFVLNDASDKTRTIAIYTDIFLICIITALLSRGYQSRRLFIAFIVLQMIYGSVVNGYYYLKDYDMYLAPSHGKVKSIMLNAMNKINDDSFYRMEKTFSYGKCDGSLFNYKGISNFSSTENLDNVNYIRKLGIRQWHPWGVGYTNNMPEASESLFGMKYILTDKLDGKNYVSIGSSGETKFYKNSYALPILFPSETLSINTEGLNNFELQNTIWKSINHIEKNVFDANDIMQKTAIGNAALDSKKENVLEITVNKTGSLYISIPNGSYSIIKAEGNTINKEITYDSACEIYYIGELSKGDHFNLIAETNDDNYDLNTITCYTEDKSVIAENASVINRCKMSIEEVSSSHLEMSYEGTRKYIATTIPYDEGWTIYDNGDKIAIQKNWDNFISFALDSSDTHQIKLIYRPAGFHKGCIISLLSLIAALLYASSGKSSKKKKIFISKGESS